MSFAKHIIETLLARILTVTASFLVTVIIARFLGPELQGTYAISIAVVAVGAQLGCLGFNASNNYLVSNKRSLLPVLVGNSLILSISTGLFVSFLLFCFSIFIPDALALGGILLLLVMFRIPVEILLCMTQDILLGINNIRAYNLISIAVKILFLVFALILWATSYRSVDAFFIAGLISTILGVYWIVATLSKSSSGKLSLSVSVFRGALGYGAKSYVGLICAFLVLKSDLLMLQAMLGEKESGYYSISAYLAESMYMLPVVVGSILFPRINSMKKWRDKWSLTIKTTAVISMAMFSVCLIAYLLAKPVINFIFGEAYATSVIAFIWLIPGVFFISIETVLVKVLNSIGLPVSVTMLWLATAILNIFLNLWCIQAYGIIGASIASSISYGFILLGVVALCIRFNNENTKVGEISENQEEA